MLEQNATVGLTNKILAKIIDRAFVSYEETAHMFRSGRVEFTGNPVDRSIIEASKGRAQRTEGKVRIVVMGGSQGAKAIDERVPAAIEKAGLEDEVEVSIPFERPAPANPYARPAPARRALDIGARQKQERQF